MAWGRQGIEAFGDAVQGVVGDGRADVFHGQAISFHLYCKGGFCVGKAQGVIQQVEQGQLESFRFCLEYTVIHADLQMFFCQQGITAALPVFDQRRNSHATLAGGQAFQLFQFCHGQQPIQQIAESLAFVDHVVGETRQ